MVEYKFKYGDNTLIGSINKENIIYNLLPKKSKIIVDIKKEIEYILNNPINSRSLKEIVKKDEKIVIIVSDITRAWINTNKFLIHIINYLTELGIKDEDIEIIIALGGHRKSTQKEKITIVGNEVYNRINVYDHECEDNNELVYIGDTSRKTPIFINKRVHEADRIILTGGIVFHSFAGFGGGAKAILPGVVGMETIQANHRLNFNLGDVGGVNLNASPNIIKDNPVREDMIEACKMVGVDFLINAVLDSNEKFIKFVSGDFVDAWIEGCNFTRNFYGKYIKEEADIIIASSGGYPKDINLYQGTKASENAFYGGKDDSVLILICKCEEGLGADEFADWFKYKSLEEIEIALKTNFTVPGYVAYKVAYTSKYRKFILISELEDELVKSFGMIPCHNLSEAITIAYDICNVEKPKVMLMPYAGNTLPILLQDK